MLVQTVCQACSLCTFLCHCPAWQCLHVCAVGMHDRQLITACKQDIADIYMWGAP